MRMITVFLTAILIASFPLACQAKDAICGKDTEVHKALHKEGFFTFLYALTDYGFMLQIYVARDGRYFVTAEAAGKACVLATGEHLWLEEKQPI